MSLPKLIIRLAANPTSNFFDRSLVEQSHAGAISSSKRESKRSLSIEGTAPCLSAKHMFIDFLHTSRDTGRTIQVLVEVSPFDSPMAKVYYPADRSLDALTTFVSFNPTNCTILPFVVWWITTFCVKNLVVSHPRITDYSGSGSIHLSHLQLYDTNNFYLGGCTCSHKWTIFSVRVADRLSW